MASEFIRQHRERQAADKLLLKIKMREHLAARIESFAGATNARSTYWQQAFRRQYRRMIGVDVECRAELRRSLEAIVAGAANRVCDVLSGMDAVPQQKGSTSDVGELSSPD